MPVLIKTADTLKKLFVFKLRVGPGVWSSSLSWNFVYRNQDVISWYVNIWLICIKDCFLMYGRVCFSFSVKVRDTWVTQMTKQINTHQLKYISVCSPTVTRHRLWGLIQSSCKFNDNTKKLHERLIKKNNYPNLKNWYKALRFTIIQQICRTRISLKFLFC